MSTTPAAPRQPRHAKGKLRVAELLDAAGNLFASKGYEATTMTEIAAAAGASIGSLYQYFPAKGDVADALYDRYVMRGIAGLDEILASAPHETADGLARALIRFVEFLSKDREAVLELSDAGIVKGRGVFRDAVRERVVAILLSGSPDLDAGTADTAATVIAHVLKVVHVLIAERPVDERAVEGVHGMLTLYIQSIQDRG